MTSSMCERELEYNQSAIFSKQIAVLASSSKWSAELTRQIGLKNQHSITNSNRIIAKNTARPILATHSCHKLIISYTSINKAHRKNKQFFRGDYTLFRKISKNPVKRSCTFVYHSLHLLHITTVSWTTSTILLYYNGQEPCFLVFS